MDDGTAPSAGPAPITRRWTYAPPPWVMFEAVVNELDRWLPIQVGQLRPRVAQHRRPTTIALQPWLEPEVRAVELSLESHGQGTAMTVVAHIDARVLPDERRGQIRHGLGRVFGSGLRDWVDESHEQARGSAGANETGQPRRPMATST